MYDELVSGLRYCAGRYGEFESDHQCGLCPLYEQCYTRERTMEEAADAIEELKRRCEQFQYMPPPAWIPVTERLPEEAGHYITAFSKGEVGQNLYMTFAGGSCKWYQNSKDTGEVTHWMPLPEPPKEEH